MRHPVCYVVGAGEDYGLDFVPREEDLVIAADAGYRRLKAAGLRPRLVVGDFDTLGAPPEDEQVVTLPKIKDVTDTWAAIQLGLERGYRSFALYGCTGGRFEHTLANLQILADLADGGVECCLVDKNQVITAISGGMLSFGPECCGFVSVFSHSDVSTGVTIRGMKYELEGAELTNRFPLGVSNEFLGVPSSVTVEKGTLLVVLNRKYSAQF